jgi:hypothetical protein
MRRQLFKPANAGFAARRSLSKDEEALSLPLPADVDGGEGSGQGATFSPSLESPSPQSCSFSSSISVPTSELPSDLLLNTEQKLSLKPPAEDGAATERGVPIMDDVGGAVLETVVQQETGETGESGSVSDLNFDKGMELEYERGEIGEHGEPGESGSPAASAACRCSNWRCFDARRASRIELGRGGKPSATEKQLSSETASKPSKKPGRDRARRTGRFDPFILSRTPSRSRDAARLSAHFIQTSTTQASQ